MIVQTRRPASRSNGVQATIIIQSGAAEKTTRENRAVRFLLLEGGGAEAVTIDASIQAEGTRFISDVTPVVRDRGWRSGEVMEHSSGASSHGRHIGQMLRLVSVER